MKKTLQFIFIVMSVCFSQGAFSQVIDTFVQWTWMTGSTTGGIASIYGTKGVPSTSNVLGSRVGAMTWTDAYGNFWLFGGEVPGGAAQCSNDLWKYDRVTNIWTWVGGPSVVPGVYLGTKSPGKYGTKGVADTGNIPGARYDGCSWVDVSGNFWLFGGYGYDKTGKLGHFNDLWKYSPITSKWTWVSGVDTVNGVGTYGTKLLAAATNVPGSRRGAYMNTDAFGNFWLFGGEGHGQSGRGAFNDVWRYNPSANMWTWMNGGNDIDDTAVYGVQGVASQANTPQTLVFPGGCMDASGNIWIFGGSTAFGGIIYLNTLWKFNTNTNQWTWMKGAGPWVNGSSPYNATPTYGARGVPAAANTPQASRGMSMWIDVEGNIWQFGGYYNTILASNLINQLWKYDVALNQWVWMRGSTTTNTPASYGTQGMAAINNTPGGLYSCSSWKDDIGNIWLFGGVSNENTQAGTSTVSNTMWKLAPPQGCHIASTILTGSTSFCVGDTVVLVAYGGGAGCTYQWQDNAGNPIAGATDDTLLVKNTGAYKVVMAKDGCSVTASAVTVTFINNPPVPAPITGNALLCVGETIQLSSATPNGKWSSSDTSILKEQGTGLATGRLAGVATIKYTVTNGGNCYNSITKMITVAKPVAAISQTGVLRLCDGDSIILIATAVPNVTYQWMKNGATIANATTSYTAKVNGNYQVMVTDANSCKDTSDIARLFVNALPNPTVTKNGKVLTVNSGYASYQWYVDGQVINGATYASYTTTKNGSYYVVVTDNNGCSKASPANNIGVGIATVSVDQVIKIYPNPADRTIYINAEAPVNIIINSIDGKVVLHQDNAKRVDVHELISGFYIVKIFDDHGALLQIEKLLKN